LGEQLEGEVAYFTDNKMASIAQIKSSRIY
jgi:hypothetical protein